MNDELFRPRGLYCLVMAYDTNSRSERTPQNSGTGAVRLISHSAANASSSVWGRVRSNDGVTGAPDFPVSAELVYPDPADATPTGQDLESEEREDSETRTRGSSLASRLIERAAAYNARQDLKSQVEFQRKNPTSLIKHFLDPSAELGDKDLRKQEKRAAKQEKTWEKEDRKAEERQIKHPERDPREHKIREGILYLMIINMPSNEEMNLAHGIMGTREI